MANSQRALVVFVDALGPAQLERAAQRLDFLPHRRALRGILGYSSGALPTILTGASPAVHGRMCLFSKRRDQDASILSPLSWLRLLPRAIHERAPVRRLVSRALASARGLTGYVALHRVPPSAFQWLDLPERDDLFQTESIGPARTFLADARAAGLSVFAADWRLPEAERWTQALRVLWETKPDLSFLYTAELDAALHTHGAAGSAIDPLLSRAARRVERAREALASDGASLITILVGDHGMADVTSVIDPRPILASLPIKQAFVDSTMLRLWGTDAELSSARLILERSGALGSWLSTADLDARRAPTAGDPYGRALWLLPEGSIFAPSFVGGRVRGMHGYDVGTPSSFAALASDDPAALQCDYLSDIGGLVRRRLGLQSN